MGDFEVRVKAVGKHGCQRTVRSGGQVQNFCGDVSCADCITREFLRSLKRANIQINHAFLTHYPSTPTEVKDDLITGTRLGSF